MVLAIKHLKVIERHFPSTREAETEGISMSLRSAWHTNLTPGRSGLHRGTLSQKKKELFNFFKQITYVIRNILQIKNILCSLIHNIVFSSYELSFTKMLPIKIKLINFASLER